MLKFYKKVILYVTSIKRFFIFKNILVVGSVILPIPIFILNKYASVFNLWDWSINISAGMIIALIVKISLESKTVVGVNYIDQLISPIINRLLMEHEAKVLIINNNNINNNNYETKEISEVNEIGYNQHKKNFIDGFVNIFEQMNIQIEEDPTLNSDGFFMLVYPSTRNDTIRLKSAKDDDVKNKGSIYAKMILEQISRQYKLSIDELKNGKLIIKNDNINLKEPFPNIVRTGINTINNLKLIFRIFSNDSFCYDMNVLTGFYYKFILDKTC